MCNKTSTISCVHGKMKDFGLLALRLALGAIFIYAGYGKLGANHAMVSGMMGKMIGPESAGSFWAYFVGGAELLGGVMLVLGVFACYAAMWLSVTMIVAILVVHISGPFSSMYAPLAILGGTLALIGSGAGRFRLVQTECHCPKCKAMCEEKCAPKAGMSPMDVKPMGGCCGGAACGDKK